MYDLSKYARLFTGLVAAALLLFPSRADSLEGSKYPSIDDLAWLSGYWSGLGFEGSCEEFWSPPTGGSMCGTFKLTKDGQAVFYEFFTMTDSDSGPVLKLKHFNPDLTGWEEKDEYLTFTYKDGDIHDFTVGAVTYTRTTDTTMSVTVVLKQADGSINREVIKFTRQDLTLSEK